MAYHCVCTHTQTHTEPMLQPADYNPNARQFDQMFVEKRMTDMCPLVPPAENLVDSLTQVCRTLQMSVNVWVCRYSVQLELGIGLACET